MVRPADDPPPGTEKSTSTPAKGALPKSRTSTTKGCAKAVEIGVVCPDPDRIVIDAGTAVAVNAVGVVAVPPAPVSVADTAPVVVV